MRRLFLTLNEDLVRALEDLSAWEESPELSIAAKLVQLALEKSKPRRDLGFRFSRLTNREREVASLLVHGLTHSQICQQLHISPQTLKTHLRNIRQKMGLNTNTEIYPTLKSLPLGLFPDY